MSIATDEAVREYPTFMPKQVTDGFLDGDRRRWEVTARGLQAAYVAGRMAAITDAEIDAVAAIDCADSTNGCCEFADEFEEDKRLWRNHARTLLEAARKAVTE